MLMGFIDDMYSSMTVEYSPQLFTADACMTVPGFYQKSINHIYISTPQDFPPTLTQLKDNVLWLLQCTQEAHRSDFPIGCWGEHFNCVQCLGPNWNHDRIDIKSLWQLCTFGITWLNFITQARNTRLTVNSHTNNWNPLLFDVLLVLR